MVNGTMLEGLDNRTGRGRSRSNTAVFWISCLGCHGKGKDVSIGLDYSSSVRFSVD